MSELFCKSEQNIKSANLLIKERFYAPSVHCSYYSCVNLIQYVLSINLEITEKGFDDYSDKESQGKSSHIWLINSIFLKIFEKSSEKAIIFKKVIFELKDRRKIADYKSTKIELKDAQRAYYQAEAIIKILTKLYL